MKRVSKLLTVFLAVLMILYTIPLGVLAAEVRDRASVTESDTEAASPSVSTSESSLDQFFSPETEAEIKDKLSLGTFEIESLRDAYTKHIRLDDGSYVAMQYSEPVHKLDSEGKWREIDNTLSLFADNDRSSYITGDGRISFAGSTDDGKLYCISENGYTVEFSIVRKREATDATVQSMKAPRAVNATRKSTSFMSDKEAKLSEIADMTQLHSSIVYDNLLPGADIEYVLDGLGIKENIIVKTPAEKYVYEFAMRLVGLSAVMCSDGSIELRDSENGEVKYYIPLPYMYDASGERSNEVSYSLVPSGKNVWTLTVTASSEWINSPDRDFPVTIDPPIYSTIASTITDTYIDSAYSATSYSSNSYLKVSSTQSALWKSSYNLSIPPSAYIDTAQLIANIQSGTSSSALYIKAHQITSSWTSSVTYSSSPSYNSTALDFNYFSPYSTASSGIFDITEAFRDWHYGVSTNYGIMLRGESSGSVSFYSNDYSVRTSRPVLRVHYVDMRGVEGWYPTVSHSIGSAGTGAVNAANGSLNIVNPLISAPNFVLPYTATMSYDTALAGKAYVIASGDINVPYLYASAGRGWKLSMSETVVPASYTPAQGVTGETYYIWTDSDGTEHAFLEGSDGKYRDEDGLGMTLEIASNGEYVIKDRDHNVRTFAVIEDGNYFSGDGGILRLIADKNNNRITYVYDSYGRVTNINFTPGSSSSPITQLTLVYHTVSGSMGPIKYIVNPSSGEGVVFRYSSTPTGTVSGTAVDYLREVHYVKQTNGGYTSTYWSNYATNGSHSSIALSSKACYNYNSSGNITYAIDSTAQYQTYYSYTSSGEVQDVIEYGNGSTGQKVNFTYYDGYTRVRGSGKDDSYGNSDDVYTYYIFDNSGRAINVYSTDIAGSVFYGASSGVYSQAENAENKLESNTVTGGSFENLVTNGGFEVAGTGVPRFTVVSGASVSTSGQLDGRRCLKFSTTSSSVGKVYQSVYLTKGDYTFSAYVNAENNSGTTVTLSASLNDSVIASESVPVSVGTESSGYVYASLTFTASSSGTYTVEISASASTSAIKTVYVDNVMLTPGVCTTEYNMIEYGGFETGSFSSTVSSNWVAYGSSSSITTVATGNSLFGRALRINGGITAANYVDQTIYEATSAEIAAYTASSVTEEVYTVSAWAKGTSQVKNNDLSKFGVYVEITYYNGSTYTTDSQVLSFNPNYNDWQFLSTSFATDPTKGMVTKIILSCAYVYQPGMAYFDKLSLVRNSETTTSYEYDTEGRVIRSLSGKDWTETFYDEDGNVQATLSRNKHFTYYTYDDKFNCTKVQTGIYTGTLSGHNLSTVTRNVLYTTDYTYSGDGLLYSEKSYSRSNTTPTTVKYTYDEVYTSKIYGANLTTTDTYGGVTRNFYDSTNGRLLATISPDGNGVCYTYNAKGILQSVKPAVYSSGTYSALSGEESATYTYDSANRLSTITTGSTTYRFTYDSFGNAASVSAGSSEFIEYAYNSYNGKVKSVTYGNGYSESYTYDAWGRTSRITESNGSYYDYEYDSEGRLYRVSGTRTNSGISKIEYIYKYNSDDSLNKVVCLVNGAIQNSINYRYDTKSRLSTYEYSFYSDSFDQGITYIYSYDNEDRVTVIDTNEYSNGYVYIQQNISYDSLGRLSMRSNDFQVRSSNVTGATYSYTYKTASVNGTTQTGSRIATMSVDGTTYSYTYDANGNITQILIDGVMYYRYSYDDLGQLTREDNRELGYSYVYKYDDAGNMIERRKADFNTGLLLFAQERDTYTYSTGTWGDQLTAINGASVTYDGIGNITSYNGKTLTWDGRRLKSIGNYSYSYNDEGIRIAKYYNNSLSVKYHVNGTQILAEEGSDWSRIYIYDETGSPIGFKYHGSSHASGVYDYYYYVKNLQGDVTKLYGADGTLYATYKYDAWGNHTVTYSNGGASIAAVNTNPIRYRSYYYDSDTELYYLNSRYYSPVLRRFISPDSTDILTATPTGLTDKNLYAYCDNNPVMRVDGGGEFWHVLAGAAIGGLFELGAQLIENKGDFSEIDWLKVGVATVAGGLSAALPGCASVFVSGFSNMVMDGIDGELDDLGDVAMSFGEGVLSELAGIGASKISIQIAGKIKIKSLYNKSSGEIKSTILSIIDVPGNYRNKIKDFSFISSHKRARKEISRVLAGDMIPTIFSSTVSGFAGLCF